MYRAIILLVTAAGFLVAAAPAQAGGLTLSQTSDGAYHYQYFVPRYTAGCVHVYGDIGSTVFADRCQSIAFTNYTGATCSMPFTWKVVCDATVSSVRAWFGAENDVYVATGMPWLSSTVFGHAGNDQMTGGAGDDTLYGGSGDDVLDGRLGSNQLFGNLGTDTCVNGVFSSCEITP